MKREMQRKIAALGPALHMQASCCLNGSLLVAGRQACSANARHPLRGSPHSVPFTSPLLFPRISKKSYRTMLPLGPSCLSVGWQRNLRSRCLCPTIRRSAYRRARTLHNDEFDR